MMIPRPLMIIPRFFMMIPIDDLGGRVPAHAVESEPIDFPINLFLNVTCQIFMIPYRFVLCGQPPHVNSQLRISVEEPESTAMTSSRMTVTTRGS